MFVIGDQQQRLSPNRTRAQGRIDIVDQLVPRGNIVVRMLTVATSGKGGLQKRVRRQSPGGSLRLEIAKVAKVTVVGVARIGKVQTGQRISIIAEDRPINRLV